MREKIISYPIKNNGSVSLQSFEKHFRYESYHLPDVYKEATDALRAQGKTIIDKGNICLKIEDNQRELF